MNRAVPAAVRVRRWISSSTDDRALAMRAGPCARPWSTSTRHPRPAGLLPVVLGPDGRACCSRGGRDMASKATSTAREPRRSPGVSANRSPRHCAPWSMTAPCRTPRLADHRRRRHAVGQQCADRKRHPQGLHAGHDECPTDGGGADRQWPPRESYAHLPMPRMTNTYMLPGQHKPDEIIASVKHGLYAVNFGGGQVDITSGKFVFQPTRPTLSRTAR